MDFIEKEDTAEIINRIWVLTKIVEKKDPVNFERLNDLVDNLLEQYIKEVCDDIKQADDTKIKQLCETLIEASIFEIDFDETIDRKTAIIYAGEMVVQGFKDVTIMYGLGYLREKNTYGLRWKHNGYEYKTWRISELPINPSSFTLNAL